MPTPTEPQISCSQFRNSTEALNPVEPKKPNASVYSDKSCGQIKTRVF